MRRCMTFGRCFDALSRGFVVAILLLGFISPISAQEKETRHGVSEKTESAKPKTAPEADAPKKGPRYLKLRYQEDWSYLEGDPGSYEEDLFDPIKNIDLGGDWRLDIGGSVRFRLMSDTNRRYGAGRTSQDTYLLEQYLLHANLRYRKLFRFFIEGLHAQADERQTQAAGGDENFHDFHQAFIDLKLFDERSPLTLRFGRQEMSLGKGRHAVPPPWSNKRGTNYDGVRLMWRDEPWNLDGFYLRPVTASRGEGLHKKLDEYDEDQHFFGLYSTYKGWARHGLDVYYLVLLNNRPRANAQGSASQLTLHTFGARWWGGTGSWDYEVEGAMQLGHHSGDEVFAWMLVAEGGYTLEEWPTTPRLAVGLDWASGDPDPNDNQHHTYYKLFGSNHGPLGWMDQVGRQNIIDPYVKLTIKPCKPVKMTIAYHQFFLDRDEDALYSTSGGVVRQDRRGDSGNALGGELNVGMDWNIDKHSSLKAGWAHFWPGGFIDQTGDNDVPNRFYLQYMFTF